MPPVLFDFCDNYSYFILNCHLERPAKCISDFAEQFLKAVEDNKFLPQEVLVKRKEAFELLEPVTSRLGIKLRNVKRLTALEKAKASMFKFLTK